MEGSFYDLISNYSNRMSIKT